MSIGYQATGDIGLWGEGTTWNGVVGLSHSTSGGFGVWGHNDTGGTGVVGESTGWIGTAGFSASTTGGSGVYGEHRGAGAGVFGKSELGTGVVGDTPSSRPAVWGHNRGAGSGVIGTADRDGAGVFGQSGTGPGVQGLSNTYAGVEGISQGINNPGVRGIGRIAGEFSGSVTVRGNFTVMNGTKNFKIDHPLDPQNRYLLHNAVESSEMKNVYDGIVQLDAEGTARVELPEWFEALNGDFRYQLTAVGRAAPNLHVAEEISENSFGIAGGERGMKVCWQVTGSRKDPWAAANPFELEQEKPEEERGRYLQADLYDAPEEQSIMRARMGEETLRQMREEPPQAPQMSPAGFDRPLEERLRQTYELRRQAEAQEHSQQIAELRRQIEELRRQQ